MRYTRQQRAAFGEAYDYLNGRDAMRLLAYGPGATGASLPRTRVRHRTRRASSAPGYDPCAGAAAGMKAGFTGMGIVLALGCVSIGLGIWAISKLSGILLGRMRRPRYYPREKARRNRLAKERRRVRDRFTVGDCPDPEKLAEQYAKAKGSAREALLFGSMLCDLEAYCDNSLIRNEDGEITGRNPGMKGWIRDNCPGLLAHYKNAMRYKGLAEKFRQAVGAADPVPAATLAAADDGEVKRLLGGKQFREITVRMRKSNGPRGGKTVSGTYAIEAKALEAARNRALEILDECERVGIRNGKESHKPQRNGKNRLRCVTDSGKTPEGDCGHGDNDRLRSGRRRNGAARLEEILDARLDEAPMAGWRPSRWRIGVAMAGTRGRNGIAFESA